MSAIIVTGIFAASGAPAVITCHDLNHYVCPSLKGTELLNWKFRVRGMLSAARIIAISHHLAGEITSFLKIPPERVPVAYYGVDTDVFSIGTTMQAAERFPHLAELRKRTQKRPSPRVEYRH
jgi:hypothetical protein